MFFQKIKKILTKNKKTKKSNIFIIIFTLFILIEIYYFTLYKNASPKKTFIFKKQLNINFSKIQKEKWQYQEEFKKDKNWIIK